MSAGSCMRAPRGGVDARRTPGYTAHRGGDDETHLCSHIGLDLRALLLLALEDGSGVPGDVLEALDDIRVLSGDEEVARRVRNAGWGRHGRGGGRV